MRNEGVDPDRAAHCGKLADAPLELFGDTNELEREHRCRAKLPKVGRVHADVISIAALEVQHGIELMHKAVPPSKRSPAT